MGKGIGNSEACYAGYAGIPSLKTGPRAVSQQEDPVWSLDTHSVSSVHARVSLDMCNTGRPPPLLLQ